MSGNNVNYEEEDDVDVDEDEDDDVYDDINDDDDDLANGGDAGRLWRPPCLLWCRWQLWNHSWTEL